MAKRKRIVTFSVDPDLVKKIDRVAKSLGMSRSEWIERSLRDSVAGDEIGVKVLLHPGFAEAFMKSLSNPQVLKGLARAMGEEVSDEQLELFGGLMRQVTEKDSPSGR